jgi:hypothetical protein
MTHATVISDFGFWNSDVGWIEWAEIERLP